MFKRNNSVFSIICHAIKLLILVNFMPQESAASEIFSIQKLSEKDISQMLETNVLKKPYLCDPSRLRLLQISYYDFDGKIHRDGKIVVLDAAAENVINIFKKLFDQKFPLQRISLLNEFKGDDDLSMNANNSSAFNQRAIAGRDRVSIHSYGLAIDINPVQNPYVIFNHENATAQYLPAAGIKFANRLEGRPNKPNRAGLAENVEKIFYQNGFNIWGGNWDDPIDYQHFQTSRGLADLLVVMDARDAKIFFEMHVKFLNQKKEDLVIQAQSLIGEDLKKFYLANKTKFMEQVSKI